jgi:hypothetical protein
MNDTLDQICNRHGADKGSIGHAFAWRYEPFFSQCRHQPIALVESGVQFGASARVWLEYFTQAAIIGVDIAPRPPEPRDPRWHFFQGSMTDPALWNRVFNLVQSFQICIDDASHYSADSKAMFELVWPRMARGGIYAIEDTGTIWDKDFASAVQGDEWFKFLIGEVNWHGKDYGGKPHPQPYSLSDLEKTIDSIHFSKHLCIIVKK